MLWESSFSSCLLGLISHQWTLLHLWQGCFCGDKENVHPPLRFIRIIDLKKYLASTRKKSRERKWEVRWLLIWSCWRSMWERRRFWRVRGRMTLKCGKMWKVNRMYSRICYRFVFPEKRSGVINHSITWLPIPFCTITWFLFSGIVWNIETITVPFRITIFDAE